MTLLKVLSNHSKKFASPHQWSSRLTTSVQQPSNMFQESRYLHSRRFLSKPIAPFTRQSVRPTPIFQQINGISWRSGYLFPKQNITHSFHSCRPLSQPIGSLPVFLTGLYKSGALAVIVNLSSRIYLTAACIYSRQGKYKKVIKWLRWIPVAGMALLLFAGLNLAPNTSRIRLMYLSKDEEEELARKAIAAEYQPLQPLMAPNDCNAVIWLQNIVDNLAKAAQDDINSPVRAYNLPSSSTNGEHQEQELPLKYKVSLVLDNRIGNAGCAGRSIFVHRLLLGDLEYDEARMAVILSHEIAHSVQQHMVENHGFQVFFLILGDMARGVLWKMTDVFGPYINDAIGSIITANVIMESKTSYSRMLEYEADLVGLFILAKAGYDPRVAIQVRNDRALLERNIQKAISEAKTKNETEEESLTLQDICDIWYGSTHPHSLDRAKRLEKYMDQAVALYEESVRINGKASSPLLERPFFTKKSSN